MITTLVAIAAMTVGQTPPTLTEQEKKATIEALLDALNESYVFPDLAKKADEAVRKALAAGAYKDITSGPAFATKLSADVNAILKDAHFRMRYSAQTLPVRENNAEPSQAEIEMYEKW